MIAEPATWGSVPIGGYVVEPGSGTVWRLDAVDPMTGMVTMRNAAGAVATTRVRYADPVTQMVPTPEEAVMLIYNRLGGEVISS